MNAQTVFLSQRSEDSAPILAERIFRSEAVLVALFASIANRRLESESTGLFREFDCSSGIADVVLYQLHMNWRHSSQLGEINPRWAYALRRLPYRRIFTTEDFSSLSGVSSRTAKAILTSYCDASFCSRGAQSNQWYKIRQPKPIFTQLIAVEAKLRNWQRAVVQAARYRYFASQSWVLLDTSNVKPAIKNLDQFRDRNIGLASICANGLVEPHLFPNTEKPKSELRFWQANSELAKRLRLGT